METKNITQFMNSYSVKMIIVSVLALLLLIPSFLIQEIISERMSLSEKVKKELYAHWGGKQVVAGPVLNVPFTATIPGNSDPVTSIRQGVAHFLPETLETIGTLLPETRKRGIYRVVVYQGTLALKGTFAKPDLSQLDLENPVFNWGAAYFTIGVSDMRGIRNLPVPVINGQSASVEPGVADTDLFSSGITVRAGSSDLNNPVTFEIELVLNGSENLSVEALGKSSSVSLQSDWSQPGFTGEFLPSNRIVTDDGFTADWLVTHLNRNFPQQWTDRKYSTTEASFGVELLIPVDHYQKSMRSAKYAILFIALNFIIFLFIEIKSKTRIHPFQYSLVAFALLLFYILLTSIGEQIGFNLAYLVSALAVTALISWYSYNLVRNKQTLAWVTLLQSGLYLFLFAILQLQDYALLAGSIGLFLILAIIMKASQKIRWYAED
ncbi:MAG TPA: cell envelope integrity protein CreD [Bacteroidales bacterium]|jgi:inner membrane protein|nr:cell envelope integrity protein CreD [Bacteroidales bacterium]HOX77696.1 cell envelope integrity protein CreD [Bacteroidales bacterium]HPI85259.1 cell envelope integrity protein CreD [Bacteroidales bacterium]HPM92722.1 cell envelope integrity protein CreD [Bacteroidales bacterium]